MSRLKLRTPSRRMLMTLTWLVALVAGLQASSCSLDERDPAGSALDEADIGSLQPCGDTCPEVTCPADDVCRDYSSPLLAAGSCNPTRVSCATVADCPFSWKPEAREGTACECGAAGCALVDGEACTRSESCASGSCSATNEGNNVCCAALCASGEACAADGSACVPATPCSEGTQRCSGAVYQTCSEGVWETATDCGALGCDSARGGCLRLAGQSCEEDADCGEGTCLATVDGNRVCCTGECGASCRRCSADGTACENIEDDDACGVIECPSDACRSYDPPSISTNRCAEGACLGAAEACTSFVPQRADLECSPSSLCDDQGNCSRPKKATLAPCALGNECTSGSCVATVDGVSVCCATPCAANQVCGTTGECELAPACESGSVQCSGSSFQRCVAGQWQAEAECGAIGCSLERGGCLAAPGEACATDLDCGVGRCQPTASGARVCCTAACDGACRACAASGTACDNLPDDDRCGAVACPTDSTCRDFPPSVTSNRCTNGSCGSGAQLCVGTPRAIGQVCSATSLCDNAGNCAAPKKAVGAPCMSGAECATNSCVDGVCCNGACGAVCETCAGTGICRAATTDAQCGTVQCSRFDTGCVRSTQNTTGACVGRGQCRTENDCGFLAAGGRCGNGVCDGAGQCGPSVTCGNVECPLATSVCCARRFDSVNVRCIQGTTCPEPTSGILAPDLVVACDQDADCPGQQTCCYSGTSTSYAIGCQTDCSTPMDPMFFEAVVCESPFSSRACPAGQACENFISDLPGYFFCRQTF